MKTPGFTKLLAVSLLCVASFTGQDALAANASGLPWNSGAFLEHSGAKATQWEQWRGARADVFIVFPSRDNWGAMLNTWWYNSLPSNFSASTQDVVVALPLWPLGNSVGNTGSDAQWRQLADQIEAKDPNAWVRLGWEMNIGQYWAVTNQNRQQWIASFRRIVDLMKSAAPNLRFAFNPNHGGDQSCTPATGAQSCTRVIFQAVKDKVDAYGIDSYDSWNPVTDRSSYYQHLYDYGGLVESAVYANNNGKKFVVPEWGVACNVGGCQWQGHAGGDNPLFIEQYLNFFYEYRSVLAFEAYYEESASFIRSALLTNPIGSQAPLVYKTKIKGFAIR